MASKSKKETVAEVVVEASPAAAKESKHSKEQILRSKKYRDKIDIVNAVLGNDKYTIKEVDDLINNFLNKEVK